MQKGTGERAGFMRRLAYYAIGLAIGFMMLGLFQRLRTQEHQARVAEREQRGASVSVPGDRAAAAPAVSTEESVSNRGSP